MKFPTLKPFASNNKLAIELLKLAKENLREGESYYLCTAILTAADKTSYEDFAHELWVRINAKNLVEWVQKMLGEHLPYVTQTNSFLDSLKVAESKEYRQFQREYRLAWADHLISYLETFTMNYLDFILSQGYRVFTRPNTEYCFYTDGTKIGYAQWSRNSVRVASVHKPSRQAGTGYGVADSITEQTLQAALTLHCQHWDAHNADNVKKYKDWDEFHNENDWSKTLVEYKGANHES